MSNPCRKFTYLIFICVLLLANVSFSQQNVSTDIHNINLAVFDAKNLQMELSYQVFLDNIVQSEMKGTVKKSGTMLHQQIGSITIIKKEPYCLFIDADRKLMILDPYYPGENTIDRNTVLNINMDSLKKYILATDAIEKGNNKEYTFTLKKGQFSRIILEFNTKNYFLQRIELHQREDYKDNDGYIHHVKMQVSFDEINNKTKLNEADFDISKYVNIDAKKKKAIALGNYKNYKFNSNIDKSVKFK